MRLFKAHGLGNDYVVLESGAALSADLVNALCLRHHGVGADGILEPFESASADHGVRIWNPDGSIAEKSGNGLRIFAYWLHRFRGAGRRFSLDTGHDVVQCDVGEAVTIQMGEARVRPLDPLFIDGAALDVTSVNVGNPHAVIWTEQQALDSLPWRQWGATLEHDLQRFPHRTNVQLARTVGDHVVEARIWERGAGETLASGSSACAVAAVAVHRGHQTTNEPIQVRMPGGTLTVTVDPAGQVVLTGPVDPVGWFEVDGAWVALENPNLG